LAGLVRAVDQVDGLKRLRLSSIDPDEVDEDLQDAILNGKTTCQSLHIVLQAGSNVVLKKMNRKYTRQIFLDTIRRLRAVSPDFGFTTDVIVGFPGETDLDFQETLEVMEETKFAKVHMFPFSARPRTRAALYPNQIPSEIIQKRKQEVLRKAENLAFELRERYIGRTLEVLTESTSDQGYFMGHTTHFLPVLVPQSLSQPNQIVSVRAVANSPQGLIGEAI